jgi:hypothetical protein
MEGAVGDFRHRRVEKDGIYEDVDCYAYSLFEFANRYTLSWIRVGADNWIVCLNDPFPTPDIRAAFPGRELRCFWYSPEELG